MEVNIAQGHLLLLPPALRDFQARSSAHTVSGKTITQRMVKYYGAQYNTCKGFPCIMRDNDHNTLLAIENTWLGTEQDSPLHRKMKTPLLLTHAGI